MLTDRSERFLAAELIREQLFLGLRQEVPYAVAVVIESWEERERTPGDVVIAATIVVERDSQRAIVLGKGGAMIRDVGTRARARDQRAPAAPRAPQAARQGRPGLDDLARRARALRVHDASERPRRRPHPMPRCRWSRCVGRPNVGKSSLFNRLVGGRPALVEDVPGVTRDRRYGVVEWGPAQFRVVDTGGLDPLGDGHPGRRCASRRCARSTRPTWWCSSSTRARA